jgi:2-phospho-L-lactate guanylyltransferase (CobY/MobA/RfbA family)
MFLDVRSACEQIGEVRICNAPGGQNAALAAMLLTLEGPVAIVNSDVPCATPHELRELVNAAPALVSAADGTTNAIVFEDARDFQPLYGPGSADRFGLKQLYLPGLCEDIDTEEALLRLAPCVGSNTRSALLVHARA